MLSASKTNWAELRFGIQGPMFIVFVCTEHPLHVVLCISKTPVYIQLIHTNNKLSISMHLLLLLLLLIIIIIIIITIKYILKNQTILGLKQNHKNFYKFQNKTP